MQHDDQNLAELMYRATEGLRPSSTDLVQRAMRRGLQMRRRRTAGRGVLAAATVLALAGAAVVTARSIGAEQTESQVGAAPGSSAPQLTTKPGTKTNTLKQGTAGQVPENGALAILQKVVPATFEVSDPEHWDGSGFTAASIIVNDEKGLSQLVVLIERQPAATASCPAPAGGRSCTTLQDGSVLISYELEATNGKGSPEKFPHGRPDQGVKDNRVELRRPDGVVIGMTNYNAPHEKGGPDSRPRPPFSVEQLTSMVRNPQWKVVAQRDL